MDADCPLAALARAPCLRAQRRATHRRLAAPSACSRASARFVLAQAGEGQAGGGTLTKRPGSGAGAAPKGASGAVARRGAGARKPSSGRPGGGQGAGILSFYTDDAPGLKM